MQEVAPRLGMSSHEGFWNAQAVRITARVFLLAGMIAGAGVARAQSTLPDSQVEANVLKAMAGAPELANQSISTNTVYGVVTLTGTVQDDAARVKADNLAANAAGVKKVVDQLQVGTPTTAQNDGAAGPGPGMVLQSDGTYAPDPNAQQTAPAPGTAPATTAVMNDPDNDQAQYQQQGAAPQPQNGQAPQPQTPANGNGAPPPAYPNNNYPQNRYPAQQGYAQNGQPWGGQVAGQPVLVPVGAMLRVRVNRPIASNQSKPGDTFDGFVANDVVANGLVAIPRGAAVQGTVVAAKSSGAVSGRGELSIQLTSLTLGGKVYPLASDIWARSGPDKTGQTVSNAAGLGFAGALIGAIAGRGEGAAIGAGVGAAAGVGASAASPRGQVVIPPEGMVVFHLAQPAALQTVSEQEMQRLAYGVPQPPQYARRPMYARPYGYPPPPPAYPPY